MPILRVMVLALFTRTRDSAEITKLRHNDTLMALWEALLASTKQISDGQIIPNGVDNLAVLMMMKLWTYPEKVEGLLIA